MTTTKNWSKNSGRRKALKALGLATVAGTPLSLALAQGSWQASKPLKIVVPFPPGGGSDVVARLLATGLQQRIGQVVVVENKPGASGAIGSDYVFDAEPDGHTLLLSTMDTQAINPHVSRVRFDALKFVPICGLAKTSFVLMGRPAREERDLRSLIAEVKRSSLTYASAGKGTSLHVLMAASLARVGAKEPVHVPYQGVAPALQALLADQVDLMMVPLVSAVQHLAKLKVYGTSAPTRLNSLPDVPTFSEGGLGPAVESWFGLVAPPGTATGASMALNAAVLDVMTSREVGSRLADMGLSAMQMAPAEFASFYFGEYRRWGATVREARIGADT